MPSLKLKEKQFYKYISQYPNPKKIVTVKKPYDLGPYFALQKYHKLVKISNRFTVYIFSFDCWFAKAYCFSFTARFLPLGKNQAVYKPSIK